MNEPTLMTLAQFNRLNARQQGYVHYMQAAWPGSPLPKECPYRSGTKEYQDFRLGAMRAVLEVQDSEA